MQDRVKNVFVECLGVSADIVTNELEYASIPQWDSIAHMTVIVGLEDEFDIMIETDDVIDMSSVDKAFEIVNKYL
ncbi:acyl carrier protein [Gammaproteobacteria bacterium]|nr:acyl carrier protein [Gammaproteobacteria bacterium]